MAIQIDDKVVDEKTSSKEINVAIENIKQLNQQRDSLILNLERNKILTDHYTSIIRRRTEDKK
jgi:hypothetical protein|tara:strand:- start:144 stop:332 length:189 start_codon:yes stop_codon:yes gene_type:complete